MNRKLLLLLLTALFLLGSARHAAHAQPQQLAFAEARARLLSDAPTAWALPSGETTPPLRWYERNSSFASENIRTFVGYHAEEWVGCVSLTATALSGEITWKGTTYRLHTNAGNVLLQRKAEEGVCGTCCSHSDEKSSQKNAPSLGEKKFQLPESKSAPAEQFDNEPFLFSDGVLRLYRLALMVEHNVFSTTFRSDVAEVKRFWATTETALNEIYMRDLGIKFQVVNNEHLIRKTKEEELHSPTSTAADIIAAATTNFDQVIGQEAYDVGLVVTNHNSSGIAGLASLYGVYEKGLKGYALSTTGRLTIGHEIGHLFGSEHTFTEGGDITLKTEPSRGTSIMSYGHTESRDFFSLVSIWHIKNGLLNSKDYYTDTERTATVGPHNSSNIPYGIPTSNHAPAIDRSKIARSYRLPKNTNFQFRVPAADPDGDPLYYAAHQTDIRRHNLESIARFRTYKPTRNNLISFHPAYNEENGKLLPYSGPTSATGNYTFWIAAYDGLPSPQSLQENNHCTRYDIVQTSVQVEEGTPFQIKSITPQGTLFDFQKGQKVAITWDVDPHFFPADSKVRILLSDDMGHTFPYVLEESTPNDGRAEIVIPFAEPKSIRKYTRSGEKTTTNSSLVFKIEVIDHIAHAMTNNCLRQAWSQDEEADNALYHQTWGGYSLQDNKRIVLSGLPPHQLRVPNRAAVPPAANVTATRKSGGASLPVTLHEETVTPHCIKRTWSAQYDTNNAHYVQHIYIDEPSASLAFIGELPQDVQVSCLSQIPERKDPQHTGSAEAKMHFQQIKVKGDDPCYSLQRIWTVTAPNALPIRHTQTIVVHDYTAPEFSERPSHMVVRAESEIPLQKHLTATDNCDGAVAVRPSSSLMWDSRNGRKQGVIYRWQAQDLRQQETAYEQYVFIDHDGTLVKTNVADLKRSAIDKGQQCIARISNLVVTYNDGWKAYVEDGTGGMLLRRLPSQFKAGDRLSDNFELIVEVSNGGDKYNRDLWEYKAHQGSVKQHGQPLPLQHITISELLSRPQEYAFRRIMVEGVANDNKSFSRRSMTLREQGALAGTPKTLTVKGEFPTPIAASNTDLALIGYYAPRSDQGAFLEVVQQKDVWGKLSMSAHGYSTLYIDAPFTMPVENAPFATSNGTLRAGIVTDATAAGKLTFDYRFLPGTVVPTETPLILNAEEGDYFYNFTLETPDRLNATNYLRGSLTTQEFQAQSGEKFYHLTDRPSFGFYWQYGTSGNSVRNAGGKSFLAIPAHLAGAVQGFSLSDEVTAIGRTAEPSATEIYDLSGRRVARPGRGIYIVNGKKVIR